MSSRISEIEPGRYRDGANTAQAVLPKVAWSPLSLALIGTGLAAVTWTIIDQAIGSTLADFNGRFCLPLAAGIALIVWGALLDTKWKDFGGWFSVALVGQAASLQMIDAGRLIHFQHYRFASDLIRSEPLAVTLLILQIICVAIGAASRLREMRRWMREQLSAWQALLIVILLGLSSAAVTPDLRVYGSSLIAGTLVQVVSILNILLLAWSVPRHALSSLHEKAERFLGSAGVNASIGLDRFSLTAALWVAVLSGSLSYFVYQAHPHVPDEAQYIFQANYMAAGQLTVKPPAVPEAFEMYMVPYREGRWFSIFPPGWPALLAVGTLAGANWIVNPLLAGLCVLFVYILFQQLYSRREARLAVLLLSCSPWLVLMGMSFMSHVSTLLFSLIAATLLIRGIRSQRLSNVLFAGVALGIVFLIRPLDALIAGVVLGIGCLLGTTTWKRRIVSGATLLVGSAASASLIFPYNRSVTGSPTVLPMDSYYDNYFGPKVASLGFGPERGLGWPMDAWPGHSPLEALINAALNVFQLNTELFGWGVGSLLLVMLLVVRGRVWRKDLWAWGSVVAVAGTYSLFWYHGGPDFGARYWFLCLIPLLALTVRGIELLWRETDSRIARVRVLSAVFALCAISVSSYIPWRAADKYVAYLGMHPGIRRLAGEHDFGKSLVLIRGSEHPDYQSAWIYNSLNFEGEAPIYAFDKTPEIRAALLRAYPDRRVWIVDGPSIAGGEYRIRIGPIEPNAFAADIR